jgi:hypothetical protein
VLEAALEPASRKGERAAEEEAEVARPRRRKGEKAAAKA